MAVHVSYVMLYILIFCIPNLISKVAVERSFSDFKRCADEECSIILYRGRAFSDFTGPDCRFLSFKRGETIYVYYKLSGRRTDIWAGSVGIRFGYFNKVQLIINHIYTEKELEIPAEEADFFCYDTGYDKFDSYDIDSLLGSSLLLTDNDESVQVTTETFDLNKIADSATVEVDEPPPEVTLLENYEIHRDVPGDIDKIVEEVPDDEDLRHVEPLESSLPLPETLKTEHTDEKDKESLSEFVSEQPNNDTQTDVVSSDVLDVVQHDEAIDIPEVHETEKDAESHTPSLKDNIPDPLPRKETKYSDDVLRLTLLRDHFKEEDMERFQNILGLQNLFRVEFLFSDLEQKLKAVRLSQTNTSEDIEKAMEAILEASETPILDEIVMMLDAQENADLQQEAGEFKDAAILDDFQELVLTLHQKYSKDRNSAALALGSQLHPDKDGYMSDDVEEEETFPHSVEDTDNDNLIVTETSEETKAPEKPAHNEGHKRPDMGIEEDFGYFNRNKDNQPSSKTPEEIQRGPQTIFENTLDMGLSVDMDHPPLGSLESPPVTEVTLFENYEIDRDVPGDIDKIVEEVPDDEDLRHVEPLESSLPLPETLKTEHTDEKDKESLSEFGSEQPNNDTQTDVVFSDVLDVVQHDEAIDIPEIHETEKDAESHTPSLKDNIPDPLPRKETKYSDNVLRLTLLRDHFKEEDMERFQNILGLQNLFRVEFLFSDLEQKLKAVRLSQTNTSEDIEKAMEAILEASETPILDEIVMMLDAQENADLQQEAGEFKDAAILDDFQELVLTLHQKYSKDRNSAALALGSQLHPDKDGYMSDDVEEEETFPHSVEDTDNDNLIVTETSEETKAPEKPAHNEGHKRPDMGIEEDFGYFNRNKDNQPSSKTPEEIQRGPQTIFENTLDMGLSVDMDHPPLGSLESPPVTDFHDEEQSGSSFISVLIFSGSLFTLFYEYLGIYGVMMVTCLPEQWKPGPDFFGMSCEPVLVTAGAGVIGFLFLFWRSILFVKSKSYLKMMDRMKRLEQEKKEILQKVAELQQQGDELKEKLSEKSATSSLEKIQELENIVQEMERQKERLDEESKANTAKHEDMMSEMDKTIEKLKRSRKKRQDALSKATILMDEAKLREDARNVQHQVLEKDVATLKEENLSLHHAAKLWEEKHRETSEQIKVYQKSQKDLEDSLVHKDHSIEVLSDLLGDLEACDDLKGGVVANGEASNGNSFDTVA